MGLFKSLHVSNTLILTNYLFICAATTMTSSQYAGLVMYYKLFTNSNNHLSESKGTRKGSHKARAGHSHGVDFSMGY